MAKKYGARSGGRYLSIPHVVTSCNDFISLGGNAVKLLVEAARQYNGSNNGKICFVWSQMCKRGWASQGTLDRAKKELISKNLLVITKAGGFDPKGHPNPTFYALTWHKIDEVIGFDMDVQPTTKAIRIFSLET
ncbi:hypothetical protein RT723_09785 [Psychrosphaera aquimarina]|uniref:Helix-turn-helix domain-containing protein n=1 Tax=Psychrosphaera aquimarina TaxID=2044854 RepID=A0ABU3R170_9GAMM|nr:hypothetical protein [Psychrosphaera aquimarina]MDU0113279.1 hypothetical protein [Psychrosphaera aquimarina]